MDGGRQRLVSKRDSQPCKRGHLGNLCGLLCEAFGELWDGIGLDLITIVWVDEELDSGKWVAGVGSIAALGRGAGSAR